MALSFSATTISAGTMNFFMNFLNIMILFKHDGNISDMVVVKAVYHIIVIIMMFAGWV